MEKKFIWLFKKNSLYLLNDPYNINSYHLFLNKVKETFIYFSDEDLLQDDILGISAFQSSKVNIFSNLLIFA